MVKMPEPTSNCKIIDDITIGPIPKLITLPKSVPNKTARYLNLSSAFALRPCNGML